MQERIPRRSVPSRPRTVLTLESDPGEVARLIARAESHPLGLGFLRRGSLDSVAATFQTHAFLVESARRRLRRSAG